MPQIIPVSEAVGYFIYKVIDLSFHYCYYCVAAFPLKTLSIVSLFCIFGNQFNDIFNYGFHIFQVRLFPLICNRHVWRNYADNYVHRRFSLRDRQTFKAAALKAIEIVSAHNTGMVNLRHLQVGGSMGLVNKKVYRRPMPVIAPLRPHLHSKWDSCLMSPTGLNRKSAAIFTVKVIAAVL